MVGNLIPQISHEPRVFPWSRCLPLLHQVWRARRCAPPTRWGLPLRACVPRSGVCTSSPTQRASEFAALLADSPCCQQVWRVKDCCQQAMDLGPWRQESRHGPGYSSVSPLLAPGSLAPGLRISGTGSSQLSYVQSASKAVCWHWTRWIWPPSSATAGHGPGYSSVSPSRPGSLAPMGFGFRGLALPSCRTCSQLPKLPAGTGPAGSGPTRRQPKLPVFQQLKLSFGHGPGSLEA
jgi:hypothetical protein